MATLAQKQRLFTAEEYHAMARAGILSEDDRVELIDGKIVAMSPIGASHLSCVNRLNRLFVLEAHPEAVVSVQNPIRLGPYQEPEPDVVLLRPSIEEAERMPGPEDVLLVVEVADTSLAFDREVKRPRYAAAGIPEVWIVVLEEDQVEVARQPTAEGYAETRQHGRGEALRVEALPHLGPFPVEDILGSASSERV